MGHGFDPDFVLLVRPSTPGWSFPIRASQFIWFDCCNGSSLNNSQSHMIGKNIDGKLYKYYCKLKIIFKGRNKFVQVPKIAQ